MPSQGQILTQPEGRRWLKRAKRLGKGKKKKKRKRKRKRKKKKKEEEGEGEGEEEEEKEKLFVRRWGQLFIYFIQYVIRW